MNLPLAQTHPGGVFIGFNAGIDRKSVEQLVTVCGEAARNQFQTLNLLLSSEGGLVDHAYYACTILNALPIKLVTWNIGSVQSAANLLFLCGKERYAIEGSTFYFHQTHQNPPQGQLTASFVRRSAKGISREDTRAATFISQKTGRTVKDALKWAKAELYMDTRSALANGIIEGVKAPLIPQDALFQQIPV